MHSIVPFDIILQCHNCYAGINVEAHLVIPDSYPSEVILVRYETTVCSYFFEFFPILVFADRTLATFLRFLLGNAVISRGYILERLQTIVTNYT